MRKKELDGVRRLLPVIYLHKLVALQDHCGLKDQLTVLHVVLERRRINLTERHELLKRDGGNRLIMF